MNPPLCSIKLHDWHRHCSRRPPQLLMLEHQASPWPRLQALPIVRTRPRALELILPAQLSLLECVRPGSDVNSLCIVRPILQRRARQRKARDSASCSRLEMAEIIAASTAARCQVQSRAALLQCRLGGQSARLCAVTRQVWPLFWRWQTRTLTGINCAPGSASRSCYARLCCYWLAWPNGAHLHA